jgi:hypothetical protein
LKFIPFASLLPFRFSTIHQLVGLQRKKKKKTSPRSKISRKWRLVGGFSGDWEGGGRANFGPLKGRREKLKKKKKKTNENILE